MAVFDLWPLDLKICKTDTKDEVYLTKVIAILSKRQQKITTILKWIKRVSINFTLELFTMGKGLKSVKAEVIKWWWNGFSFILAADSANTEAPPEENKETAKTEEKPAT